MRTTTTTTARRELRRPTLALLPFLSSIILRSAQIAGAGRRAPLSRRLTTGLGDTAAFLHPHADLEQVDRGRMTILVRMD
jgi:hypothetical protein